jgi:hypothetical protein
MVLFKDKPWANVIIILSEFSDQKTKDGFADQLGVGVNTVSSWACGKSRPNAVAVRKIVESYLFNNRNIPEDFKAYIESVFARRRKK